MLVAADVAGEDTGLVDFVLTRSAHDLGATFAGGEDAAVACSGDEAGVSSTTLEDAAWVDEVEEATVAVSGPPFVCTRTLDPDVECA